MEKLAIHGGPKVIDSPPTLFCSVGAEERASLGKVIDSGCLSGFMGTWSNEFFGGKYVQSLENAWCKYFNMEYAITVNSATSGLYAAMGAIGIEPGDEVIVPPYTMSATALAPILYGGIPVFVDIDPMTFCLDTESVKKAITHRTKAILTVNLFGHPSPLKELMDIAKKNNLFLIEDNAQSPLAEEHGEYTGTIGHIGIFSLNVHKHIQTGEGGVCVTNSEDLAKRLQMIRNHGENVIEPLGIEKINNLVGFNFRMSELTAAVGIEQLKKINYLVDRRVHLSEQLSKGVHGLKGLMPPFVRDECKHVYYIWSLRVNEKELGISRYNFCKALKMEGVSIHSEGYVKPLYLLPIFQKRIAFGSNGYPFNLSQVSYKKGICPVTEQLYENELVCFEMTLYDMDTNYIDLLIKAIHKVYEQRADI